MVREALVEVPGKVPAGERTVVLPGRSRKPGQAQDRRRASCPATALITLKAKQALAETVEEEE